jgi:hypothetical protein
VASYGQAMTKAAKLRPTIALAMALVGFVGPLPLEAANLPMMSSSARAQQLAPLVKPGDRFPNGETPATFQGPVAQAKCGRGSNPESSDVQGSVPVADRESGRSSQGYWCNLELVGRYGPDDLQPFEGAGWQLGRYGHCAYYSQRIVNPTSGATHQRPGTVVVDVSDPTDPKFSANIATLGMLDPWENLKVSQQRGILVGASVIDGTGVGYMGIYDVRGDCVDPKKLFDGRAAWVTHEGNLSSDGTTYYTGGMQPGIVSAVDISDPTSPRLLTTFFAKYSIHGYSTSPDGKRLFISHVNDDWQYTLNVGGSGWRAGAPGEESLLRGNGIGIYDVSEIQERKPDPKVRLIAALEYQDGQMGQHSLSFVKEGVPYVVHVSEAGHGGVRIIDISDERNPEVISKLKTEIMMPEHHDRAVAETKRLGKESGGDLPFGYNIHYCNLDQGIEPTMLACSAFESGLRLFDIRDLRDPKELGYYNPGGDGTRMPGGWCGVYSGYAPAMPQFEPTLKHIWFTDQCRGLYVVKPANGTWISDVTEATLSHGN